MSAIGGYYDFSKKPVGFERLHAMGNAMILRGKDQQGAGLYDGAAILCNRGLRAGCDPERMPFVGLGQKQSITVAIDGAAHETQARAEALSQAYERQGILEALRDLEGGFALTLYDASEHRLLLARDGQGKKPLYFSMEGSIYFFASELRGLRGAMAGPGRVDLDALEKHILLPPTPNAACRLYRDVGEVLPGEAVLLCEEGIRRFFFYRGRAADPAGEKAVLTVPSLRGDFGLRQALSDSLYAFEYPQFDGLMPRYIALLRALSAKGCTSAWVEDAMRFESLPYAYEREDRLGERFGLSIRGVTPSTGISMGSAPWQEMADACEQMLQEAEQEDDWLIRLFGEGLLQQAQKAASPFARIRMLGLLLQSRLWACTVPLSFQSASRHVLFS